MLMAMRPFGQRRTQVKIKGGCFCVGVVAIVDVVVAHVWEVDR
jgi:hypothetical protein